MEKHTFCSPSWVNVAREYIESQCAGKDLSEINLSFCERFTDAPPELATEDNNVTGWHIRISNGELEVGYGTIDDADLTVTADYNTILPLARTVFEGNEEGAAEAQKIIIEAMAAGTMKREGNDAAMAPATFLAGLHDVLAKQTL